MLTIRRWPRIVGLGVLLVVLVDPLQWGWDFNPVTSIEYRYPDNAVVDQLRQDNDLFRVLPLQSSKIVFGPNVLSQFKLQDVTGYSSLIKNDYYQLIEMMDDQVEIDWMAANDNMLVMSHFHNLLSLLNVKYVLSAGELPNRELEHRFTRDGVWIYENPNVAPRAFLVHHVQQIEKSEVLQAIDRPGFNWLQSVYLTTELPPDQVRQLAENPGPSRAAVTMVNYTPNQVEILVETPAAGLLVLTDAYYPGWQVTVDGELGTIHEADFTMRSVFVPAGEHNIQFSFKPRSLYIALYIALGAVVMGAAILLLSHKRRSSKF